MLGDPAQDFLLNGTPNPRLKVKRINRIKMRSHAGAFDQRPHREIFPADTPARTINSEQRGGAAKHRKHWPLGPVPLGKRRTAGIAIFIVLDEFEDHRVGVGAALILIARQGSAIYSLRLTFWLNQNTSMRVKILMKFRDRIAEDWLRTKSKSLLSGLQARWKGPVQDTIVSGMEQGMNPSSVGLELAGRINRSTGKREGGSVALGDWETRQVCDFRRCIVELDEKYFEYDLRNKRSDSLIRRAMSNNSPVTTEKTTILVNQFEARMLKAQCDMLARTEMLSALNRSAFLSVKEAIGKSDLPEIATTRIWDSCGDENVRPSHAALDGQVIVGFDDYFISPVSGAKMMYPGDTSLGAPIEEIRGCRCGVRYCTDFCFGVE
jgi:hypothetical protein